MSRRRPRLLLRVLAASIAASAAVAAAVVVAPPAAAATTPALELLSRLPVCEQSTVPLDPALFSFTSEPYTCTAASFALLRDSEVQASTGLGCSITNGRWRS